MQQPSATLWTFFFLHWKCSCFKPASLTQLKEKVSIKQWKSNLNGGKNGSLPSLICCSLISFPTFNLQVGHTEQRSWNKLFFIISKCFLCNLSRSSPFRWECACINETPSGLGMKGKHLMLWTWLNTSHGRGQKLGFLTFSLCRTSGTVESYEELLCLGWYELWTGNVNQFF